MTTSAVLIAERDDVRRRTAITMTPISRCSEFSGRGPYPAILTRRRFSSRLDRSETRSRGSSRQNIRRLGVVVLRGLFLAVAISFLGIAGAQQASAQQVPMCSARTSGSDSRQASLTLERVNGTPISGSANIPFGDSRSLREFIFDYKVSECRLAEETVEDSFEVQWVEPRDTIGGQLLARVEARGVVKSPEHVLVVFTLDPDDSGVRPGQYNTGFVVADRRFVMHREDVTATFRYHSTGLIALTVLLPVVVVGSLMVWYKGKAGGSQESFLKWLSKLGNVLALGIGLGTAVVYLHNTALSQDTFGGQLHDHRIWEWIWQSEWFKTAGGTGSAFVTAVLGSSLLGDFARRGTDEAKANGPAPAPG